MNYIIVWLNSQENSRLNKNSRGFLEKYDSYEDAKEEAEKLIELKENPEWYFDYEIYKTALIYE